MRGKCVYNIKEKRKLKDYKDQYGIGEGEGRLNTEGDLYCSAQYN